MNNLERASVNQLEPGDVIFCDFYPNDEFYGYTVPKLIVSVMLISTKSDLYSLDYVSNNVVLKAYCLGDWYALRLRSEV